ncbi:MAG: 50S ribosomal protein L25/general stress protein Ctc [Thermosulfidibacteraceae bacterium]|jgi:large subunit ribosomal protein L25
MVAFEAVVRDARGKGVARKLRRSGYIPAVIYGGDFGSKAIAVKASTVQKYLKGLVREAHVWKINIEGIGVRDVIVKDVQKHPVTGEILHIDFYELVATRTVSLAVPLKFVGECIGVKKGGTLEIIRNEIEIECLPKDIVEEIEVDVSSLDIGDTLFVRDIKVPEGIRIALEPDEPVVTVVTVEEEEEIKETSAEE